MSCEGVSESAMAKFWRTPELAEKLLGFLDGSSTLNLARCHNLTKETLQRPSVWTKVVRRLCPVGLNQPMWDEKALVATNKKTLMPLLQILKMAKDPAEMKLTLLEVICERFPLETEKDIDMGPDSYHQFVKVRFSCPHKDHSVSAVGFLLLEEVEIACGSSPNLKIDQFDLSELEGPMLLALSRRASKQKEPLKQVNVWAKGFLGGTIRCNTIQQSEALLKIAKNSQEFNIEAQLIVGDVKKKGWAALAKMAEIHGSGGRTDAWRTFDVTSRRDDMLSADREDLEKIWKAMHGGESDFIGGQWDNSWHVTSYWRDDMFVLRNDDDGTFRKGEGSEEWGRLLKVLDMSKKEWDAKWVAIRSRF